MNRECSKCKKPLTLDETKFYKLDGKRTDLATQVYFCSDCGKKLDLIVSKFIQEG